MTQSSPQQECLFCEIAAGRSEASIVHADDTVVVFMDRYPVTPGHLLVVPRAHMVGFEDLEPDVGARVWAVGHRMARALRRSTLRPGGINVFVCDGELAFQSVFHFHLHVIPRYPEDGWAIEPNTQERSRRLLDEDARAIRDIIEEPWPGAMGT